MRALTLAAACLVAAFLVTTTSLGADDTSPGQRVTARVGLERVYAQFGESVALSARQGGIGDAHFREAWEAVARKAFATGGLDAALAARLDAELGGNELAAIEAFFASELGQRIGALEAAVQRVPPGQHVELVAKGQALLLNASPVRQARLSEVLALGSAEVTFAMLKESLRGMALGLHLSKRGDLSVPWEEIDARVTAELSGMETSLREASLGTLAFALAALTDEELGAYVEFLRAPGTQKFQALTAAVIGRAIHEAMGTLGPAVAARLGAIAI